MSVPLLSTRVARSAPASTPLGVAARDGDNDDDKDEDGEDSEVDDATVASGGVAESR
jgi:hypothetical protein